MDVNSKRKQGRKTAPIRVYLGAGKLTKDRHDALRALALAFGFQDDDGIPNLSGFIQAIADGRFKMRLKKDV